MTNQSGAPTLDEPSISAAFPYTSKFVDINGHKIHYVEQGQGPTVLFIHGCPTSCYLWRNILPRVANSHRVVALDLLGSGQSDKPRTKELFKLNSESLASFIETLQLTDVHLVLHDWGAALGFDYAMQYESNISSITFMEGVLPPKFPQASYSSMGPDVGELFKAFRDPIKGKTLLIEQNVFIEQTLPQFVIRKLDVAAWQHYKTPYKLEEDRNALQVWPMELPIAGEPSSNVKLMKNIESFMAKTELPMLLLYATPGTLIPPELVAWYQEKIINLTVEHIGKGLHFIQEDEPELISEKISTWLLTCNAE